MLPLRSYWLALLVLSQEVCCPRRLLDPASLADWLCSYLCSELIPSVTEKSLILIKELSFPQTAPIDDAFFNRNWAGACWGRWAGPRLILDRSTGCVSLGLGYDCCCADRQVLNVALLYKNKKEGGSARASPVAAPMPKSVSF